ncbi:MAG: metal ABC transporter ATP-binding protein [Moraxella sp.]|nr:metal ABC transporter ATP-binding protein [Moraxella sp.]
MNAATNKATSVNNPTPNPTAAPAVINDTPTPLLSIHQANFRIGEKTLIKNVSLDIYPYETISLIGPNGAGKSTLVKLILGLLPLSDGSIHKRANLVISYVPQKFTLPDILPLQVKNLLTQTHKNRLSTDEKQSVFHALAITPLLKTQVATLSGGELQRVLLAKALLDRPDLLILDEPMQGLDPEAQNTLYALIDALPDFLKCAMLVVSHDLHWVMKDTKRVICLNRHICCEGVPSHIATLPEFINLFGHYPNSSHQAPYIHHHDHCHHHA